MGSQTRHMYLLCSFHRVMQAEKTEHLPCLTRLSICYHLCIYFIPLFPLFSRQVLLWTRMDWYTLWTAPRSGELTKAASYPHSWAPMTSRRHAPWPVTSAWTSSRWLSDYQSGLPQACSVLKSVPIGLTSQRHLVVLSLPVYESLSLECYIMSASLGFWDHKYNFFNQRHANLTNHRTITA